MGQPEEDQPAEPDAPADSPKILIYTRQGKCVGIYCHQPAKVLVVETHDDLHRRTVQEVDFVYAGKMRRPGEMCRMCRFF
jgi:hypothetical protein